METNNSIDSEFIGKYVIVRTYSAGVHFGKITDKQGSEVILTESRGLYRWDNRKIDGVTDISLSGVSKYGLADNSKVCTQVDKIWLSPIEIIECTDEAAKNIKNYRTYSGE